MNSEEKKLEKCKHNAWNGYGLMMLRNRLSYIKNDNPRICKIYNGKGEWKMEVSESAYQDEINDARRKRLKVELQDNSKLVVELEASIKRVEEQIKEHKENCKDYIIERWN